MASFDCWHFSCPCENNVCQKPCSTIRVIQRRVRMPMTLSSSRKASLAVSKVGDTFSGPSDRLVPSVNTLTGKVGVDKKHNSFARYLARKTGPVIRRDLQYSRGTIECGQNCCCKCAQRVDNSTTGLTYIPQVGDTATQASSGATGKVTSVGVSPLPPGDLIWLIIANDDCTNPFVPRVTASDDIVVTGSGGQTETLYVFSLTTTKLC